VTAVTSYLHCNRSRFEFYGGSYSENTESLVKMSFDPTLSFCICLYMVTRLQSCTRDFSSRNVYFIIHRLENHWYLFLSQGQRIKIIHALRSKPTRKTKLSVHRNKICPIGHIKRANEKSEHSILSASPKLANNTCFKAMISNHSMKLHHGSN